MFSSSSQLIYEVQRLRLLAWKYHDINCLSSTILAVVGMWGCLVLQCFGS